ncbi:MAG: lipocalin family protein [Acidobacteriota bacterium]
MERKLFALVLMLPGAMLQARADGQQALVVVSSVDLSRYAGKWYEIARLPNRFQKDCAGDVTATYSLLEGDQLLVVNECRQEGGQNRRAEGKARLADKRGPNSKLKVRFAPSWLSWLPAVWGDYWIIDLSPDYSHAVVGTPDRKYLWILARTPQMDEALYQRIVEQTAARGFDVSRLVRTGTSDDAPDFLGGRLHSRPPEGLDVLPVPVERFLGAQVEIGAQKGKVRVQRVACLD